MAEVTPIPKVKNPSTLTDFRPISLLHHLSKITEKAFATQYKRAVLPKISPHQFAYQEGTSTTDALIHTLEKWCTEKNRNSKIHVIFKDFSKAFAMMQPVCLEKALRRLSVDNAVIELALDFMTNRSLRVNVDGMKSRYMLSQVGVPQGTICGPLFWLAFIDSYQPKHTSLTAYADDITCYWSNTPLDMQGMEDRIVYGQRWCKENHMKLNLSKTKAMCLKVKQGETTQSAAVGIVDSIKFLGVMIDSRLKFNNHIEYVISKSNKRFYALLQLKRLGVDTDKLKSFYCSSIRSVLVYAIPAFYSHLSKSNISALEAIQSKCTRAILPHVFSYFYRG
jgi:hypothetical protein